MLDSKLLRKETKEVISNLKRRGFEFDETLWTKLESKRKDLQGSTENQQAKLNELSKNIGIAKQNSEDTKDLEKMASELTATLKEQSNELDNLLEQIDNFVLSIPNLIDHDVPDGKDETSNLELKKIGSPRVFDFPIKDHLEIGRSYEIDMEAGVKLTGSRFKVFRNDIAHLQRALINFMIDTHVQEHGYEEVYVPYIVNKESLIGTGQLPKFEEDLFKIDNKNDFYLTSTAEVPVTNLFRDEILNSEKLPIKYVCHTPCFRSEAGSYGKDVRGLNRLHQFDKVEMFSFCNPEKSEEEHEFILSVEEELLQSLEIPYRVVDVCAGDLGASAAKKYDIEAWIPSQNTYREVTSCSNTTSFQARRLNIRAKSEGETSILHTLNGTAIAVGRILIALIENNQTEDGKVEFSDKVAEIIGVKNLG